MQLGIYCFICECGCSYTAVLWLRFWDNQEVGVLVLMLNYSFVVAPHCLSSTLLIHTLPPKYFWESRVCVNLFCSLFFIIFFSSRFPAFWFLDKAAAVSLGNHNLNV